MNNKLKDKLKIKKIGIDNILQWVLNTSLVLLSIVLIYLLGKEVLNLINLTFFSESNKEHKELLQSILTFFLYFEFISMIVKYFQDNYHFPLRYFMYIGITASVRLIVVDHDDALQTLYFSGAILLLVISYAIIKLTSNNKSKS